MARELSLRRPVAGLPGADAERGFKIKHENLAVADLAGPHRFLNRGDRVVGLLVLHGDFELQLRHIADRLLGAAIDFDVPASFF